MNKYKVTGWALGAVAVGLTLGLWLALDRDPSRWNQGSNAIDFGTALFWITLLAAVELLPMSLGLGTEMTMTMPIHLALAILYPPWTAMTITAISAVDLRELRRELPIHRVVFNRAQITLAVGATCMPFAFADNPFHPVPIVLAAVAHAVVNLTLVAVGVHFATNASLRDTVRSLVPEPVSGFVVWYVVVIGLGVVTALAYDQFAAWAVAAIIVPILFARLSIIGARTQQELSERIRKQQQALLDATEKIFQERENERKRIAEEIHDSSLQLLAAAAYGCGNANEFILVQRYDLAGEAVKNARNALDEAIQMLRGSLVDLRRSSVEKGGLMETIRTFVDHASTLWGADIRVEGNVKSEPPLPVALAAFQILQEGLTNALKHADSSSVVVRIDDSDGRVHIVVQDDGTGFDPSTEVGSDHVGMRLMRERAAHVGGAIELESRPGSGTRLEVILPGGVAQ
ncbi:MAG TPA: sensor histidine kinase [Actinomycetota bacterium]|nr:sensor histidine kinase [Actinomycetota bacterium]